MFRHPKYYKELKKNSTLSKRSMTKNNSSHVDQEDQAALGSLPALDPQSDQAISNGHVIKDSSDRLERAPGPGLKLQAREDSTANSTRGRVAEPQASSVKPQAPEASSGKHQAQRLKLKATSNKLLDS